MAKKSAKLQYMSEARRPESLSPLNQSQAEMLHAIQDKQIILASGSAGTGKTYLAVIKACEMLYDRHIQKVVISRPNIETAKSLGALPGELDEKLEPYMAVMKSMIIGRFGLGWFNTQYRLGNIEMPALGFIQGATYDNSIIIIDEAEHLSPREMYIILTRVGLDSRIVLCGDSFQKFSKGQDGFADASSRLSHIKQFRHIEFSSDDIVRSELCKSIVKAYEN